MINLSKLMKTLDLELVLSPFTHSCIASNLLIGAKQSINNFLENRLEIFVVNFDFSCLVLLGLLDPECGYLRKEEHERFLFDEFPFHIFSFSHSNNQ